MIALDMLSPTGARPRLENKIYHVGGKNGFRSWKHTDDIQKKYGKLAQLYIKVAFLREKK